MRNPWLSAAIAVLALGSAVLTAGCAARSDRLPKEAPPGTRVPVDAGYYAEESANGRVYLIGKSTSHASFKRNPHLQITKTFIGAGKSGETIVVEADPLLPEMTDRVCATFSEKHGVELR
jgi:hypothetical protein